MPNSIVLRNINTLLRNHKAQYTQPIKSLLNFIEYKQTHFSIHNDQGRFLIPAYTIRSIVQKVNGSIINCQNNRQIHSSLSIDYWQKSLASFERFIEEKKSHSAKIIQLT